VEEGKGKLGWERELGKFGKMWYDIAVKTKNNKKMYG